jgi:hypothetical protein
MPELRKGANGPSVVVLKKRLREHKFWPRIYPIAPGLSSRGSRRPRGSLSMVSSARRLGLRLRSGR